MIILPILALTTSSSVRSLARPNSLAQLSAGLAPSASPELSDADVLPASESVTLSAIVGTDRDVAAVTCETLEMIDESMSSIVAVARGTELSRSKRLSAGVLPGVGSVVPVSVGLPTLLPAAPVLACSAWLVASTG